MTYEHCRTPAGSDYEGGTTSNIDELSAGRILRINDDGFRRFERRLDAERQTGGSEANLVAV
jgi:hypothetical protein